MGKQQVYVFFYDTLAVLAGLIFTFVGAGGPQRTFNQIANFVYFILVILIFAAYLFRFTKLRFSLNCVVIIFQLSTSLEMIYCALTPDEYHLMLIVGNMVLLAVNLLLSLIAYLEIIPSILCAASLGTYLACVFITGNASLANFAIIYLVVFVVISMLGLRMVRNIRSLDKENITLKQEEDELFELLGQDREQVLAYIEIAKGKKGSLETKSLLDAVSDKARYNIVNNIKEYVAHKEAHQLDLKAIFPQLSPSEIEVCMWILQGKTQSQLCAILDKKESNITCTRAHIRKKLGLKTEDNLYTFLREKTQGGQANASAATPVE